MKQETSEKTPPEVSVQETESNENRLKKEYATPQLEVIGNVKKLTEQSV
jgi:hypothetical protein